MCFAGLTSATKGRGANFGAQAPIAIMDTITLAYDGQDVALAGCERFWLAAHIEALPDGHPTKRLIAIMALFARDVLTGDLPGPYSDHRVRTFARLALVEPVAYQAHRRCSDRELANGPRPPGYGDPGCAPRPGRGQASVDDPPAARRARASPAGSLAT